MDRTKIELSKLSDRELAVLVKFKINRYLPPTQEKILKCVKTRKLSDEQINELTKFSKPKANQDKSSFSYKIKDYFNQVISGILEQL